MQKNLLESKTSEEFKENKSIRFFEEGRVTLFRRNSSLVLDAEEDRKSHIPHVESQAHMIKKHFFGKMKEYRTYNEDGQEV